MTMTEKLMQALFKETEESPEIGEAIQPPEIGEAILGELFGNELETLPLRVSDLHSRAVFRLIAKSVQEWNQKIPQPKDLKLPAQMEELPKVEMVGGAFRVPVYDEDQAPPPLTKKAIGFFLKSLELEDYPDEWKSLDEAKRLLHKNFDPILPKPKVIWSDYLSDRAMSLLAFQGLGSHRLQALDRDKDGANYAIDFSYMYAYPVRPGFERFGATAYFAADTSIVRIFLCCRGKDVYPGDSDWDYAKWVWKSSLFAGVTLTDHLGGIHLMVANMMVTCIRENLPPNHPIRRLLKPYIYRTVAINYGAATTLTPENGLAHRAFSFTYEGLAQCTTQSLHVVKYKTLPQMIKENRLAELGDKCPYATDSLALWQIMRQYVAAYCSVYYKDNALANDESVRRWWVACAVMFPQLGISPINTTDDIVDFITQFLFVATGGHEQMGAVVEYVREPDFLTSKIRRDRMVADIQASVQLLIIMATTGLIQPPLIGNYKHLFLDEGRSEVEAIFDNYQQSLKRLADEIDKRNATRSQPYQAANPANLESSVSI